MRNRVWFLITLCVSVVWFVASMKGFIDGSKPVGGWFEALLWSALVPAILLSLFWIMTRYVSRKN